MHSITVIVIDRYMGIIKGRDFYTDCGRDIRSFRCCWDSRATDESYTAKNWSARKDVVPVKFNVKNSPLLDSEKALLPPLHVKLGIMKKYLKVLDRGDEDFIYLRTEFSNSQ